MTTVHKLPAGTKGTQQMLSHLDGREWYAGVDELRFGDVVLRREYRHERAEDDMMRWA